MFSRWALYTLANLHLDIPVYNVSTDPARLEELANKGGKTQAPALRVGDDVMYESGDISAFLVQHCPACCWASFPVRRLGLVDRRLGRVLPRSVRVII